MPCGRHTKTTSRYLVLWADFSKASPHEIDDQDLIKSVGCQAFNKKVRHRSRASGQRLSCRTGRKVELFSIFPSSSFIACTLVLACVCSGPGTVVKAIPVSAGLWVGVGDLSLHIDKKWPDFCSSVFEVSLCPPLLGVFAPAARLAPKVYFADPPCRSFLEIHIHS